MTTPIAIITGGAQGIGRESAETLLKNGYYVTIADVDPEAGNEALLIDGGMTRKMIYV
jgi:3-oxoacyl-[acyl-carrier protein] reductase